MVDGLEPQRTERPGGAEEVAEVLRAAAGAGESVVPIGGGRALGLGNPLERFDVALEMGGLNRILDLSPADMTLAVEAGATLEEVDRALREAGQVLPIDPFNAPGHTIGGVLAAGLSGPSRLRYGLPRDFVIGLRVALPDGRLAASGGRVVKNVSGYDLARLHQGALGSLGVIVSAAFKVFPRPHHEVTLHALPDDPWTEARRALELPLPPAALELTSDGAILARLEGTREGVTRMRAELRWLEAAPDAWTEHGRRGGGSWARISVPPTRLREVLAGLPSAARWWASPGAGAAYWSEPASAEAVWAARARAEAAGGSLVLMGAPVELKRVAGVWGAPPATLPWMRRLRDAFDPARTISPGRFVV